MALTMNSEVFTTLLKLSKTSQSRQSLKIRVYIFSMALTMNGEVFHNFNLFKINVFVNLHHVFKVNSESVLFVNLKRDNLSVV